MPTFVDFNTTRRATLNRSTQNHTLDCSVDLTAMKVFLGFHYNFPKEHLYVSCISFFKKYTYFKRVLKSRILAAATFKATYIAEKKKKKGILLWKS